MLLQSNLDLISNSSFSNGILFNTDKPGVALSLTHKTAIAEMINYSSNNRFKQTEAAIKRAQYMRMQISDAASKTLNQGAKREYFSKVKK